MAFIYDSACPLKVFATLSRRVAIRIPIFTLHLITWKTKQTPAMVNAKDHQIIVAAAYLMAVSLSR